MWRKDFKRMSGSKTNYWTKIRSIVYFMFSLQLLNITNNPTSQVSQSFSIGQTLQVLKVLSQSVPFGGRLRGQPPFPLTQSYVQSQKAPRYQRQSEAFAVSRRVRTERLYDRGGALPHILKVRAGWEGASCHRCKGECGFGEVTCDIWEVPVFDTEVLDAHRKRESRVPCWHDLVCAQLR